MMPLKRTTIFLGALLAAVSGVSWAGAPATLSYQGRLQENGALVNGNRSVAIWVCDALLGGNCYDTGAQGVSAVNGVFRTTFTLNALPPDSFESGRWYLEVRVEGNILSPREQLASAPYAVVASSVPASGIFFNPALQTTALGYQAGMTNSAAENVFLGYRAGYTNTTGNVNSFFGAQAGRSNVDGIGGTFIGNAAGYSNVGGDANTFVGYQAGYDNTTANNGTFVGHNTGQNNITGLNNSFFGQAAGYVNTSGGHNSYFGFQAGYGAATAYSNSMMGLRAGFANTSSSNTFMGAYAGKDNTTGMNNVFMGVEAGLSNVTGSRLTLIGNGADVLAAGLINAGAIGNNAKVGASNALVLGGTGPDAVNIGIGTTDPMARLHVGGVAGTDGIMFPDGTLQKTAYGGVSILGVVPTANGAWTSPSAASDSGDFGLESYSELSGSLLGTYFLQWDLGSVVPVSLIGWRVYVQSTSGYTMGLVAQVSPDGGSWYPLKQITVNNSAKDDVSLFPYGMSIRYLRFQVTGQGGEPFLVRVLHAYVK
ncbi:MAG: hypothetical protein WC943_01270 [Elusimicrobiota bacterium]|jgi:hypothetical protein